MPNIPNCIFCNEENCLATLGQYCLCATCRLEILQDAMEFAKRNTVRGTVYHAAFADILTRLTEKAENEI